ncbi:MAG: RimK family alpha-L-glutamate ligase [Candidatus Hermodarchaeota archaeon]
MIKIGFITDKYHLEKKSNEFLKYCKNVADLSIYIEEEYFLDFTNFFFDENIFFVKAKGELVLNLIKLIEKETNIPVINSSASISLAFNRFLNSVFLRKAGIRIPDFTLNPIGFPPSYKEYIMKNIIDQKNYAFSPQIQKKGGLLKVSDMRAINETSGTNPKYSHVYFQDFIKSKWEYKVYMIGDEIFYFKQIPVLVNPEKMKSRIEIEKNIELTEIAYKATEAIGLKISSMDFLRSKEGLYYLTDINSSPNFNYIKNGPKIVADYLIKQAKR